MQYRILLIFAILSKSLISLGQIHSPKIIMGGGLGMNLDGNVNSVLYSEVRIFKISQKIGYLAHLAHHSFKQKIEFEIQNNSNVQSYFNDQISLNNGVIYRLKRGKSNLDFGLFGGVIRNVSIIPSKISTFRNINPSNGIGLNRELLNLKYDHKHISYIFGYDSNLTYSKLTTKKIQSGFRLGFDSNKLGQRINFSFLIYAN